MLSTTSFFCNALPVSTVYRADSWPPSDLFRNGFHAWGTHINYNSHILGVSGGRGSRDSAFIPTTSARTSAQRFAIDLLNVSQSNFSYVYTIRPTRNFYSALTTMYYLYDNYGQSRYIPSETRAMLAREQEYSAYQNIPAQLVRSVVIYSRASDGSITEVEEFNPYYIQDHTYSNDDPFTYGMPYSINVAPILIMGGSLMNINNEQPSPSASLPSPAFSPTTLFSAISCIF
ncbi:hypothetical protein [Lelliottia nimipressuralis]